MKACAYCATMLASYATFCVARPNCLDASTRASVAERAESSCLPFHRLAW